MLQAKFEVSEVVPRWKRRGRPHPKRKSSGGYEPHGLAMIERVVKNQIRREDIKANGKRKQEPVGDVQIVWKNGRPLFSF